MQLVATLIHGWPFVDLAQHHHSKTKCSLSDACNFGLGCNYLSSAGRLGRMINILYWFFVKVVRHNGYVGQVPMCQEVTDALGH